MSGWSDYSLSDYKKQQAFEANEEILDCDKETAKHANTLSKDVVNPSTVKFSCKSESINLSKPFFDGADKDEENNDSLIKVENSFQPINGNIVNEIKNDACQFTDFDKTIQEMLTKTFIKDLHMKMSAVDALGEVEEDIDVDLPYGCNSLSFSATPSMVRF